MNEATKTLSDDFLNALTDEQRDRIADALAELSQAIYEVAKERAVLGPSLSRHPWLDIHAQTAIGMHAGICEALA